ncbi:MAG: hypothetical protein LBU16_06260 [Treponema sp.]|jgi:hypothetical protein|nr:hypothetical protein [Treponema sp.]
MRKNRFLVTVLTLALAFGFVLAGCGDSGGGDSTTTPQPPAKPGKPVITAAEGQLTASWEAVSGAVSYEARIDGGSSAQSTQIVYQPNVTFTGLTNETEYRIAVRAKNAVGNSDYSDAAAGTPVAATTAPATPGKPTTAVEYNAIAVSWGDVAGATKYQVWFGTSSDSASATQHGGDIAALSTTITVTAKGTYYVWVKAGNSIGFSGFSPSATETVSALDPVIGSWSRQYDGDNTETYTFNDDGALERKRHETSEEPYTSTYTYDSATKNIYHTGNPPELYGRYSISGNKLSITRIYSSYYTRYGDGSSLTGAWRQIYDNSYDERVFESGGKVIDRYVLDGAVKETDEYSYTVSGNKITYYSQEMHVGELSGNTLNVYLDDGDDEPDPFTRKGGGSGIIGTWTASVDGQTMTLVITSSKITFSGAETEEYPCRIDGNNLFVQTSWEVTYSIDTGVTPPVLTTTQEFTEEYDKVVN